MISVVGRSACLAPALKAATQAVAISIKEVAPTVVIKGKSSASPFRFSPTVSNGLLRVSSGIGVGTQVRCAHTDIQVPDFSAVRRKGVEDPSSKGEETLEKRKAFTYLVTGAGIVTTVYVTKAMATHSILTLWPSKDVLALAKIEIDLNKIPEGKSVVFKWRGKPVFVKHRTAAEISAEQAVDVASLRDPQHDNDRVTDPKYLVVIGVCTHLGCVPISDAGDFGGYYCPCHGSHYDGSGRIRKGPAPLNLEVPEYSFPEPGLLVVG